MQINDWLHAIVPEISISTFSVEKVRTFVQTALQGSFVCMPQSQIDKFIKEESYSTYSTIYVGSIESDMPVLGISHFSTWPRMRFEDMPMGQTYYIIAQLSSRLSLPKGWRGIQYPYLSYLNYDVIIPE